MSEKAKQEFLAAAYVFDYDGMRAALDSGDDETIYSEDDCGNTALHYAVYAKDKTGNYGYCNKNPNRPEKREEQDQSAQEMVIFLLDRENKSKSNVSKVNNDGLAPLNYCVSLNLIKTVKILIEKGADANTTTREGHEHPGYTPLISATSHGSFDIVKVLLEAGADVTLYEKGWGWTALQNACWYKHPDMVKMILERIPSEKMIDSLNIQDEGGEFPLAYAVANGLTEIIPDMLSHGASLYKNKDNIHDIDKESFRRFLDDQISVKMERTEEQMKKDGCDYLFTIADTQIELNYDKLDKRQKNQNDEVEKPKKSSPENESLLGHDHSAIKVMEDMVQISHGHKKLLKHPMCIALLRRKWRKLEFLYYGWMCIKVLFLCLLITISCMEGPLLKDCLNKLRQNTTCTPENKTDGNTSKIQTSNVSFYYLVPSAIILLFMILIELLQIGVSLKWWACQLNNWFQTLILILCTLLIYDLFIKDPTTSELDLHILGLLLPMVFYELLREAGYHPTPAKYILLLDKVCKTFLKYGVIYAGLVITPAASFYLMIGQNDSVYPTEFPKLLTKTFVMFAGEVELFDVSESSFFKWIEIGFFLCFMFLLAVVLMNLLNALAIVDTKDLMDDAEMEMLSSLLETVSFWENLRLNDPHKRYKWSFLSLFNARCIFNYIVPDFSVKVIIIRPYDNKWQKSDDFHIFSKITRMFNSMKNEPSIVRKCGVDYWFGEFIVLAALKIVNRRDKRQRNEKKEKQEAERIKIKEKEIEDQMKRQEEWNEQIMKQMNTLIKFMEHKDTRG